MNLTGFVCKLNGRLDLTSKHEHQIPRSYRFPCKSIPCMVRRGGVYDVPVTFNGGKHHP